MEHRRYHGGYHGQPSHYHYIYRNGNRSKQLYQNGYRYGHSASTSKCRGIRYTAHYLCRTKQRSDRYGRRYLFVEYWRNYGIDYR